MGVHGLWQVLEPAGRPVNVHTLRGKTLAIDASIWLHQLVKGFRDKDGNPLPNAHILGVFYRVCKLLSYGIKPIFVFDGGVPILKRQTLAGRRKRKLEALDKSEISRQKMLSNYLRQQLQLQTKKALPPTLRLEAELNAKSKSNTSSPSKSTNSSPTKKNRDKFEDLDQELLEFREKFALQTTPDVDRVGKGSAIQDQLSDEDGSSEDERALRYGMDYHENFSTITSVTFDVLPLEIQHEILFEMQESRKMNSWGTMDKMPQNLKDFSSYQMDRLVKRRFLQKKIQSVQQEMGQRHIHVQNLDELLNMDYNFDNDDVVGSQEKGFVLVKKNVKTSSPNTVKEEDDSQKDSKSDIKFDKDGDNSDNDSIIFENEVSITKPEREEPKKPIPELEEEEQIAMAIKLSLEEASPSTSQEKDFFQANHSIIEPSPKKKHDSDSTPPKSNKTPAFILPSGSSSVSKFLDTVEFSSKVMLETSKEQSISSSESDEDDFETVEDAPEEVSAEESMVKELLRKTDLQENSDSLATLAVTTIDIAKVVSEAPEEDIFADIFQKNSENLDADKIPEKLSVIEEEDPEEDDTNWDSDPEPEIIEEMIASSDTRTGIDQEIAGSSSSAKRDNNFVNRTLGRNPQQSGPVVTMITADFMQAQEKLNADQRKLQSEKGFQERIASSISDQMSIETQELLSLFGIPYIVSPMEAESQCAFLDAACLTDGTITDDSDCWLFGSLRVYKNFYSSGNKQIEFYQLADITRILNLDRENLILIAMLSGGDYSEGIEGVGPVTAIEILTEFRSINTNAFDTLVQFRDWWNVINETSVKIPDLPKAREKLRKLKLRPGFPSEAVYQAYMDPSIDSSTETFHWGSPDLDAIRAYAEKKFGWDKFKCDSMLLPILKSTCPNEKSKQLTLDGFLVPTRYELDKPSKRKRGSKRLQAAFKKLKQSAPEELKLSSESSSDDEEEPQQNITETQSSPEQSSSSSKDNTNIESEFSLNFHKKKADIPQKVQSETQMKNNKRKAIEIFKKKGNK